MLLLACEGECCSWMFYTFYSSFDYSTLGFAIVFCIDLFDLLLLTTEHTLSTTMVLFTNLSARAGYDTRSIFKRSLTGLNSEFSFS